MYSARTFYTVARSPADYRLCHTFMQAVEGEAQPLAFPTIMAAREGALIGFLSSYTKKGAICAGPLVLDPTLPKSIFVALRLVEVYEALLDQAGCTHYLFHISKTQPRWKTAAEKFGLAPYHETEDAWWFQKDVTHG